MTTITAIADEVALLTEGAGIPLVRREVLSAIRRFCTDTHALRASDSIRLNENQSEYSLYAGSGLEVIAVMVVTQGGRPVNPIVEDIADSKNTNWRTDTAKDATGYYMPSRSTIAPYPRPTADTVDNLVVTSVVRPTLTATTIDSDFYSDWQEGIIGETVHRIMRMPGKDWTDHNAAAAYLSEYKKSVGEARARVVRGNTNADIRTNYVKFGG